MAKQLSSVPEESSADFTAPSYESFLSFSQWDIGSTLSSQSGQSGFNHSSISGAGASSSYTFNFDISRWASAGEADFGANELHQERSSIHKVSSILTKQLSSVWEGEDSTTGFTAPYTPHNSYRERIRSVPGYHWSIGAIRSFLSGHSGSNYSSGSSAWSSYRSNNSGYSSSSVSFGAVVSELREIARKMVSDGYTQRKVQAFRNSGSQDREDRELKDWFVELDVDWVLQIREKEYDLRRQLQLQDTSASWLQQLVDRWVRALTVLVVNIKELLAAVPIPAVARFGKASISTMLVFVDAVLRDSYLSKAEKLSAGLHMYICVSSASHDICTPKKQQISFETQSTLEMSALLSIEENMLIGYIFNTIMQVRNTLMTDDDSWAIGILRGGGEVHKNTLLMVDYICLARKASSVSSSENNELNCRAFECTSSLNDLLLTKSELCSDPSLRYLFLLNNSYFVEQKVKPAGHQWGLVLTPECEKYMDSYLEVSWGHVLSCISESNFPRQLRRWINTSSLPKFLSVFNKMYEAQKFWKVPDPQLRSLLRETITKRIIPGYRDYLKEHPELEKQASSGNSSPDDLEKMLEELFEG